jgi:CDGSH-type Zn-finger protein/uncharacterized Fe-S cluster protein YjdI
MNATAFTPVSREQLWGLLAEAAEIEHHLMCCYLYAYFSMKEREDEGLSAGELDMVKRWRGEILGVAIEEMSHLAMVCNILSATGAPAHFAHQNFPVAPGFHPAGVVVKLAPFDADTLQHFIYLERPHDSDVEDGAGFEPRQQYTRSNSPHRLMSITTEYDTVGELYHAINEGLAAMAAELGEDRLIVGDVAHQIGPAVAALPDLRVVRCLKTAHEALDEIVRQGEGAGAQAERSHFQRFLAVQNEYAAALAANPGFAPGRPAAVNPVMRKPPTPEGKLWITAEPAATLLDLGNALYNHCLRCLSLAYTGVNADVQRVLVQTAIDLMRLLTPVASRLTELPANAEHPGCHAGLSFATLRSSAALPAEPGGLAVLVERMRDIGGHARALSTQHAELAGMLDGVVRGLDTLGDRLARAANSPVTINAEPGPPAEVPPAADVASPHGPDPAMAAAQEAAASDASPGPAASASIPPNAPSPAAPEAERPTPISVGNGFDRIPGAGIDLVYSGKRCIHARHCVTGLPKVFIANVEGPWIAPDAASTEDLVTIARMCPSGAIQYRRHDGGAEEAAPPVNLLQLRENGPIGLRAQLVLDGEPIGMRAVLCRCGASKNKPFCDGSHNEIKFQATGEPVTKPDLQALAERGGPLAVEPQINGPLVITGNLELCCGTGRTFDKVTRVRLCRCGGSKNKPYCDNSHRTNGFTS